MTHLGYIASTIVGYLGYTYDEALTEAVTHATRHGVEVPDRMHRRAADVEVASDVAVRILADVKAAFPARQEIEALAARIVASAPQPDTRRDDRYTLAEGIVIVVAWHCGEYVGNVLQAIPSSRLVEDRSALGGARWASGEDHWEHDPLDEVEWLVDSLCRTVSVARRAAATDGKTTRRD